MGGNGLSSKKPHFERDAKRARKAEGNHLNGWKLDSIRKRLKFSRLLFLEERLPSEVTRDCLQGGCWTAKPH